MQHVTLNSPHEALLAAESLLIRTATTKLMVLRASDVASANQCLRQLASHLQWKSFVHGCDQARMGSYSGVQELLADLVRLAREKAPDLLPRHTESLVAALPELGEQLDRPFAALTDLVPLEERTRFYHVERYKRVIHGLVNFTMEVAREILRGEPLLIGLPSFDDAGYYTRVFVELLARRAARSPIIICVAMSETGWQQYFQEGSLRASPGTVVDVPALAVEANEPPARSVQEHLEQIKAIESAKTRPMAACAQLVYHARRVGDPAIQRNYLLKAGLEAMCRANYEDVIAYTEELASLMDPGCARSEWWIFLSLQATGYTTQSRHEMAVEVYRRTKNLFPADIELHLWADYGLAISLSRYIGGEAQHTLAETALSDAMQMLRDHWDQVREPEFQWAFLANGLALVKRNQHDYEAALGLCRRAEQILRETYGSQGRHKLHRSVLLFNIGQLYAAMGDSENALRFYDLALEIDQRYPEILVERANLCRISGRFDQALETYNYIESISPPWWDLHLNRGLLYLDMNREAESLADLECAADLSPDLVQAWENMGAVYYSQGKYMQALEAFNSALRFSPGNAELLTNRALTYQALKTYNLALGDYLAAIGHDPEHFPAHLNLATLHFELGQLDQAERELNLCMELAPTDAAVWANRGLLMLNRDCPDTALHDLNRALELQPDDQDALRWKSEACLALGMVDEANRITRLLQDG